MIWARPRSVLSKVLLGTLPLMGGALGTQCALIYCAISGPEEATNSPC